MATTIFQSAANFQLSGQQTFGPLSIPASVPYSEVVLTVNMSQAELQDATLSFSASFQLSKDGGQSWVTTDGLTWQGGTPNGKTGTFVSPYLGFDANTLALYKGNEMQVLVNTPKPIPAQITIVGQ